MLFTPEMAFEAIEKVIYYAETYEPELVRSCISNYFLAQKTSEYVKVVLTGEGTNLFVTSKDKTTNSPIHELKVLHKGKRAF